VIIYLMKILIIMRTNRNTQGIWDAGKKPDSLIINFFDITDIIGKNKQKVEVLLKNIKKEVSLLAFGAKKDNTIVISDCGMKWVFDITIDPCGNYGLLFTGLK
jgi:hypothetical protein